MQLIALLFAALGPRHSEVCDQSMDVQQLASIKPDFPFVLHQTLVHVDLY